MPIWTELERNGNPVPLRWGMWHVIKLYEAMYEEIGEEVNEDDYTFLMFPNQPGFHVFSQDHTFVDESDGEVFEIKRLDRYSAGR